MYSFNIKLDNDFNIKILIEVQMKFGIKNFKKMIVSPKEKQNEALNNLQNMAYEYYSVLADEYRRVIRDKDFNFSYDSEKKCTLMIINFKCQEYFKEPNNEWFEVSNTMTESICISQLNNVLSHIEDTLDELK